MKKFILLLLIPLIGFSADFTIDERKSDIYFANGVLTDDGNATANLNLIWKKTAFELYDGNITKMEKELGFHKAYNQTFGFASDFHESWMQLADEDMGWGALRAGIKIALAFVGGVGSKAVQLVEKALSTTGTVAEQLSDMAREVDLNKQIASYRQSIREGHGVIIVAHSQGNLFTNEAYKKFTTDESLDG